MNGFSHLTKKGSEARVPMPHLGVCMQDPAAQSRTSSRSSTEARRICLHLCTSTLWNCFCRARISAHSVAVWGNLLWRIQGLSGIWASPDLPKLPAPWGYPLTPWPRPDCARTRKCGLSSPGTRGGKRGGR